MPVTTLATVPFVVVAKADTPLKTAGALADAARSGRVTYGSAGNGSANHLLDKMFARAAKVELVHVPYRGAAPALQDLLGGQIDVVFTSLASVAGQIKTAALQPIAVTSPKRAPVFASIPTVAASGLPGFDVNPWFGLMAHKSTPRELVERINGDVNALLHQPEMAERFAAQGAEPYASSPAEFKAMLAADIEKWGTVVRASGARVD